MEEQFKQAVLQSKDLTVRPSNEDLLRLYAFFKQSTEGDISGERPGGFDFKGAAKYDDWKSEEGNSKEASMKAYIDLVDTLKRKEILPKP
jgi:diazepam-binding inhibitor (GABA receptor modulator, acyl-CoA-binding protein)